MRSHGPPSADMSAVYRVVRARRRVSRRRVLGYAAAVLALVVGGCAVAVASVVTSTPESRDAVPLALGQAFTVGPRPPLVGDVVVYGTPPEGIRPELADLGCQVTQGGGPLSTADALAEQRIVVDGRGVVPLVSFPGREGHSVACGGPAAVAAAPLYIAPGANSRGLVPLAGWSLAALLIPGALIGGFMLWSTRP